MASSSVVTVLPFTYLAIRMRGQVSVTGAETFVSPLKAIELLLGVVLEKEKVQRRGDDTFMDQVHFLYTLLWTIKKLPGLYSLSNVVSGVNDGHIVCEKTMDYPPIVFIKTYGFNIPELDLEALSETAHLLHNADLRMSVSFNCQSLSIKEFKPQVVEKFIAKNPHCVISPVISGEEYKRPEACLENPDICKELKKVVFGKDKPYKRLLTKIPFL